MLRHLYSPRSQNRARRFQMLEHREEEESFIKNLLCVLIYINGIEINNLMDTGAETNLIISQNFGEFRNSIMQIKRVECVMPNKENGQS